MTDLEGGSSQRDALDQIRRLQQDVETLKRQLIVPPALLAAVDNAAPINHPHAVQIAGMMFFDYVVIKSWEREEGFSYTVPETGHIVRVYSLAQGAITHALTYNTGTRKILLADVGYANTYTEDLVFDWRTGQTTLLFIQGGILAESATHFFQPTFGPSPGAAWINGDHGTAAGATTNGRVIWKNIIFYPEASFTYVPPASVSGRKTNWNFYDCDVNTFTGGKAFFQNNIDVVSFGASIYLERVAFVGVIGNPAVLTDNLAGDRIVAKHLGMYSANLINYSGSKPFTMYIDNAAATGVYEELGGDIIYGGSGAFHLEVHGAYYDSGSTTIDLSATTRASGQHLMIFKNCWLFPYFMDLARTRLELSNTTIQSGVTGAGSYALRFRAGGARCTAIIDDLSIGGGFGDFIESGILVDANSLSDIPVYQSRFHNIRNSRSGSSLSRIKKLLDGVPAHMIR